MDSGSNSLDNAVSSNLNITTFPSVTVLACLSKAAYSQKFESKIISNISEKKNDKAKINSLLESWLLMGTAKCGNGYRGAAYFNTTTKHIVIAHRGTNNLRSVWADIEGVFLNCFTSQMKSAYEFTKSIVDKFWKCAISISVTGHSLGGWLSQTSAFFMKYQTFANVFAGEQGHKLKENFILKPMTYAVEKDSHHLHAVAFESPGAFNIVKSYVDQNIDRYADERYLWVEYLDSLDVTTYFSSPNAINSCNLHIGSLFMMEIESDVKGSWTHLINFVRYTTKSHSINEIVNFWLFYNEKRIVKVKDWPLGLSETNMVHMVCEGIVHEFTNTKFRIHRKDINSFRMSVFDSDEREFLESIHNLQVYRHKEKTSWEILFEGKDLTQANCAFIHVLFTNWTDVRDIFGLFNFFSLSDGSQVVNLYDNSADHSGIDYFIRLVKYFARNTHIGLPKLVNEVTSRLPKIYQAIYQGFSREYLHPIPEIKVDAFTGIEDFLKSPENKIFQAVAEHSTFICVAKIDSVLKSKAFSFGGNANLKFTHENSLFLNSHFLTMLNRHVSIPRIVSGKCELKLILIEITSGQIKPTKEVQTLINNVLSSTTLIKLILVTPQEIELSQSQPSKYCLINIVPFSDQTTFFRHLSSDQQKKILDSEICFQDENIPLKNVISLEELQANDDILGYSFLNSLLRQGNTVSLGSAIPALNDFENSYYIHRLFHRIKVKIPQHFLGLMGKRSVLVVNYDGDDITKNDIHSLILTGEDQNISMFEWQGNFDKFELEKHKVILVAHRTTPASHHTFWSYFKTKVLNGYWLTYKDTWYWNATFGRPDIDPEIEYTGRCTENEMLQLQRPLVMIADEPGMGKSTLLKWFARQCKRTPHKTGKTSWVIFINLENFKQFFTSLDLTQIDLSVVVNFLSTLDISSLPSRSSPILNYLLQQEGRVTILLDGLDEISSGNQSIVFRIVDELLDHTRAKVFIASRLHLRDSLQSHFNNYINTFLPLAPPERKEFLTKFWTNHPDFPENEKTKESMTIVEDYAAHLLNKLEGSMNITQADSFIGVPLQLFMLGTISLVQVCAFYSEHRATSPPFDSTTLDQHTLIFGNIFRLYQMFVSEKIRIYLEDKCKFKDMSKYYTWSYDTLTKSLVELYQRSSFSFLFPYATEILTSDDVVDIKEIQVLLSVGIVISETTDLDSIEFIHRSLAEYFVAGFIVSRYKVPHFRDRVYDFLKKNIFLPNFDKIRFFIDHFISMQSSCDPIFGKCLEWEKEEINIFNSLEHSENSEVLDLFERNVLHYAMCYGDHKSGILWILIQNQHLFNKVDIFGCSFISYAALLPNLKYIIRFIGCAGYPMVYSSGWSEKVSNFNECFHSDLHQKPKEIKEIDDFKWIVYFSGQKASKLNEELQQVPPINMDCIRCNFEDALTENNKFFGGSYEEIFLKIFREGLSKLPTDLSVVAMRGYCKSDTVQLFIHFLCDYKEELKYLEAFERAMAIEGYSGVKAAELIYVYARNSTLSKQILDIMARNNFTLLKNSIEFFEMNSSVIDIDIWMHCNDQKEEMFDIFSSSKFLTLHRAFSVINFYPRVPEFVDDFLQFCQNLHDENIDKAILHIIRHDNDRVIEKALQNGFHSIWNFLPNREVRDHVLEKYYDTFKESVVGYISEDFDFSESNANETEKFLIKIYYSVGCDLQNRIKDDVHIRLHDVRKPYTMNINGSSQTYGWDSFTKSWCKL